MKFVSEVNCSESSNICMICSRSLKRLKDVNKNAMSTLWIIAKVSQKLYYDFFLNMYRLSVWFCRPRRCKTFCFTKLRSTRSPQSHQCLNGFFLTASLLLLFHFCLFLSQLSELVWKLVEEISLQSASKRFPSFGPPANGNKSNAKSPDFAQIET